MAEYGLSSGGNKNPEHIKDWPTFVGAAPKESSGSVTSSGSDSGVSQSTALDISGLGFYGIADAVDVVPTASGDAGVMMLDCISVVWFWTSLVGGSALYSVLDYRNVTAEQHQARNTLLQAILGGVPEAGLPNRRMVLIYIPPKAIDEMKKLFPPGRWINVAIECPEAADASETWAGLLETNPGTLTKPRFIVTHSLDDDFAREAKRVDVLRELHPDETAFLEEIFSLNHVPDIDLGDGMITPPPQPVPAPIVLDEGGFLFDGDSDFWNDAKLFDMMPIDEATIEPWLDNGVPVANKAKHKATSTEYTVVPGLESAEEGEYTVTLETDERKIELSLDDTGGIVAEVVASLTEAEVLFDEDQQRLTMTIGDTVLEYDGEVPELFEEEEEPPSTPSKASSSADLPPTPVTPKKVRQFRTQYDLDGAAKKLFTTPSKPKSKSGTAKAIDPSEADKENLPFNVNKLPNLLVRGTDKMVAVSPTKQYLRSALRPIHGK